MDCLGPYKRSIHVDVDAKDIFSIKHLVEIMALGIEPCKGENMLVIFCKLGEIVDSVANNVEPYHSLLELKCKCSGKNDKRIQNSVSRKHRSSSKPIFGL